METILVVEDEVREQRAVATFLKAHGYEVLGAEDGNAAARFFDQLPDIIVTDLRMAAGDGLELLRTARRLLPETPVIVTTGNGSVAIAVEAMKQGAFDYLTKPINPEELLLTIQRAA